MTQLDICNEKIRELVSRDGYIYAFLMTIVRDCFYDANNPEEYESRDKLITEELLTLLGFWLQIDKPRYSYPESFESLYMMMTDADKIMHEMHLASSELVFSEIRSLINQSKSNSRKWLSDEAKAQSIQEAIYYGSDPAYDYEYIHFLPRKYKYDKDWLKEHKQFDPDTAGNIALAIKAILQEKTHVLCFPNRLIDYKSVGFDDEREFKMMLEFATYMNIIPKLGEESSDVELQNALRTLCDSLLDLFSIMPCDLVQYEGSEDFLKNFSVQITDGCNAGYHRFGDYNILQATPIIQMPDNRYMIPVMYQMFVSLYETPYYWIVSDEHYRRTAGSHRGTAGEDMAYEVLEPIFGNKGILRDIEIKDSKHHTITDIDTLCLLGSKAICIQIKSKRLSQASRTGSIEQLTYDFKCAVQDAYEQGLICRKHLINQSGVFFWDKNKQVKVNIPDGIDDVYILCLTSENYPALTHQVHELLKIQDDAPYPLVFSVFDLRLITHYLDDPYKFTYYVRQRIKTSSYFYSSNEMNFLAYHLLHKLFPNPDYNREYIDSAFACEIDKDYYPFISGRRSNLAEGTLKRKWENKRFDSLCANTAKINCPKTADILFFLYDLSSDSRDKLIEALDFVKQRSRTNNTVVNIRCQYDSPDEITGITCIALQPYADLYKHMYCISEMHKYHHKANKWLTLGVYNNSLFMVDMALYADNKWRFDPTLERVCKEHISDSGRIEL